tara:strand:+ start:541 stop:942 length:402 start_codon:yes stop_codon:yes gene_type:complete
MDRPGIGPRQREAFDFIAAHIDEHGSSPSFRQIGEGIDCKSTSQVASIINVLEERGYIIRLAGKKRSLSIVGPAPGADEKKIASAARRYFEAHEQWKKFQKSHPHHADNSEYYAPLVGERFTHLRKLVMGDNA